MPTRRPTTTAELTNPAAGADEPWRDQSIPTFDDAQPALSREQQLADLDERDERLNGNAVRPSERCAERSPANIGCTLKSGHSYLHSWQSLAKTENDLLAESDAEQALLPGTPEPETIVPTEASFGRTKLQLAPELEAIGNLLIRDDVNLEHLRGVVIRYAWRRRGGLQGGSPRFARIKRPSVWEGFLEGGAALFLVDVAADHVREFRLNERQIEAALHEQLVRTQRDDDDHDAFRINGPDFSGSIATLDRYGLWRDDLREAAAHMQLLPLDQALAEADSDDGDEGEESE